MQGKGTCPKTLRHERVRAYWSNKKDHGAEVKRRLERSAGSVYVGLCRPWQVLRLHAKRNNRRVWFGFFFFFFDCARSLLRHLGSLVVEFRLSCPAACGILVLWPGIKSVSAALEGGFSTTGPQERSHCTVLCNGRLWSHLCFMGLSLENGLEEDQSGHRCRWTGERQWWSGPSGGCGDEEKQSDGDTP